MNTEKFYKRIKSEFGECCAVCQYIDINSFDRGWRGEVKYKCDRTWSAKYMFLTDHQSCYREKRYIYYDRDYEMVYKKILEERKYYRYFILTAIFEILGFSYDNRLFTEIKVLIDLVRSDESTTREAIGYDSFGPEIADELRMDSERVNLCNYLLKEYLIKIYSLIELNKTIDAIKIYENMVRFLFYRYKEMDNKAELIKAKSFENNKILVK